jgi:hypothetical protein
MSQDNDIQASPGASRAATYRGRQYAALSVLVGVLTLIAAVVVVTRSDDESPPSQPSSGLAADGETTTTTMPLRTEVISRLRSILKVRDKALLSRDADLLSGIYTVDCECLKDGRALIQQLLRENIVWRGVTTRISIKSAEEINDRLWVVVATVETPSVRIETEDGKLVRTVPPERNLVRFALAKPENEEKWLLGNASAFE